MNKGRELIRNSVRSAYQIQKSRIQAGNRLIALVRQQSEKELSEEEVKATMQEIRSEYASLKAKLSPARVLPSEKAFSECKWIDNPIMFSAVDSMIGLELNEALQFKALTKQLERNDFYRLHLSEIRGIGPAMAGVLISEIDIRKCDYVCDLWKYSGFDVAADGKGRSRREEHLIDRDYVAADGSTKTRKSITFNPFLKTKLRNIGDSFLKTNNVKYRAIYDGYKNRLNNHPAHKDKTDLHKHNMSMRYMLKQFLADLYEMWRDHEGLPRAVPYAEAKLGITHGELSEGKCVA